MWWRARRGVPIPDLYQMSLETATVYMHLLRMDPEGVAGKPDENYDRVKELLHQAVRSEGLDPRRAAQAKAQLAQIGG